VLKIIQLQGLVWLRIQFSQLVLLETCKLLYQSRTLSLRLKLCLSQLLFAVDLHSLQLVVVDFHVSLVLLGEFFHFLFKGAPIVVVFAQDFENLSVFISLLYPL